MINLIHQGKTNRQSLKTPGLQFVTPGGAFNPNISNKITFFHYDIRAG